MVMTVEWRRPRKRRVRAIRDRLRELYGRPVNHPHGHPIAELIRTVLSQHTNDRNRDRAYASMRERFQTWEEVRDAPVEELEAAIRPGGLGKQKAPRIQQIIERLGDPPDLDWTESAPREESMEFLLGLPGVGRKTSACVLIFTWGIPEIPVDVHIHRVGARLGLFPPNASFDRAHDEMLAVVEPEDAYELHMNLIRHGARGLPAEAALRRVRPPPHVPLLSRDSQVVSPPLQLQPRSMSKKTFILFGLLVLVLAALIPWLVFRADGDAAAGREEVAAGLKQGQSLFETNCGTCHTLYAAGTDGNFGPNLDELLAGTGTLTEESAIEQAEGRVLNAIEEGVDSSSTPGRMPPGILSGEQAEEVAEFVANTAGRG